MREFLFRGKTLENGEWILGALYDGAHFTVIANEILQSDWDKSQDNFRIYGKQVNPETVGQYIGVVDKKGEMVFEGDILKFERRNGEKYIGKLVWSKEYSCFDIAPYTGNASIYSEIMHRKNFEVIGNIFDNPELLEA